MTIARNREIHQKRKASSTKSNAHRPPRRMHRPPGSITWVTATLTHQEALMSHKSWHKEVTEPRGSQARATCLYKMSESSTYGKRAWVPL